MDRHRRWQIMALAALTCVLAACQRESRAVPEQATTVFTSDRYGVAFELPADWTHQAHGTSHVFAGPEGSTTYYTTLTLQGVPGDDGLEARLDAALGPLTELPGFVWDARDPVVLDGRPALRYAVRFDLHEQPRRKEGVFVDTGHGVVDLSYAAPDDLFLHGLHVFEAALASLSVY